MAAAGGSVGVTAAAEVASQRLQVAQLLRSCTCVTITAGDAAAVADVPLLLGSSGDGSGGHAYALSVHPFHAVLHAAGVLSDALLVRRAKTQMI